MLGGFVLGFAACWLIAGVIVMRLAFDADDWRGLTLADDGLPILIGVLVWPYLLTGEADDV
ncbi:hypothetical protein [Microcystis phage Mae-JY04]|uniref:hypothetical protein n=1 Tax=Blastomonas sp. TaxID=1909299 RepID=UPI0025889BE0|nr:hypothetical protein [Blastomonas sp.]